MADVNQPKPPEDEFADLNQTPYGQESDQGEDDQPRRAASARFVVDSQIGSEAAMRDAMDPANQSLADALRMSFRVLQAVILVLVVLFLVSGFQTVDEGQSGVRTVWGKIVSDDGSEELTPGAKFSIYPYPIGEFVLFRDDNRVVETEMAFAPHARGAVTKDQQVSQADINEPLRPGRDGSLLTRDGDLAHLEMSARYRIEDGGAGEFVRRINDNDTRRNADRLVRLALQRAVVQVVAQVTLQELVDQTDDIRQRVQQRAQNVLDELQCGIELVQVQVKDAYAPLAIKKSMDDLHTARVDSAKSVDEASQRANKTRSDVAGSDFPELIALIEQYENALERSGEDSEESTQLLAAINAKLDENRDGEVSKIIQSARTYKAEIESTLGNQYLRFASLQRAYRNNPQLLIRQLWLDMYSQILRRPDAEIIYVPDPLMSMTLSVNGSTVIQEMRRKAQIARKQREADMSGMDPRRPLILRGRDMDQKKMLDVRDGRPVPVGSR